MKNNMKNKNAIILTTALAPTLIIPNTAHAYTFEEVNNIDTSLNDFNYQNNTDTEYIQELGDEGIVEPLSFNMNSDESLLSRASVTSKVVINDNASLLASKEDNAGVITKIEKGETLVVLSEEDDIWSKVKYNDFEGYIKNTDIGETNNTLRYINVNSVNLRKGPNIVSDVAAQIKSKGTIVNILDSNGSFHKVSFAKEGYVYSNYLNINHENNTAIVTGRVNFRSSASAKSDSNIMAKITKGEKVNVVAIEGNWIKITYETEGYIHNKYLSDSLDNLNSTQTNYETKIVLNDNVDFKSKPSFDNSKTITKLPKGAIVSFISESDGWSKVLYDEKTGFIFNELLESTSPIKVYCTSDNVNLRTNPDTLSNSIKKISKCDSLTYIENVGNWSKVRYNKDTGYIYNKYISTEYPSISSSSSSSSSSSNSSSSSSNSKPSTTTSNGNTSTSNADKVVNYAKGLLGKPYVWGATGPNRFDCSGFTSYVFKHSVGKTLPRTSSSQGNTGTKINKNNIKKGDLITFTTNGKGSISHVGIYIGNNQFIHASSTAKKVTISNLSGYYESKIVNIRRVL